jgi:hypothetical protein
LAFHTAASFITDTNLQRYIADQQLSNLSQMIAITFVMFVAPASAIAAAFAFIRSFIRKNFGLGIDRAAKLRELGHMIKGTKAASSSSSSVTTC